MSFTLAGSVITEPHEFVPVEKLIGEQDYAADGSPKIDVVAVKTEFSLKWRHLVAEDYAVLRTLYRAAAEVTFNYPDDSAVQTEVEVVITDLDPGARTSSSYYEGVSMTLREV